MRKHVLPAIWPALIGGLLAMGITLPVLSALAMGGVAMAVLGCVLTCAICVITGLLPKPFRPLAMLVGCGILLLLLLFTGALGSIPAIITAAIQLAQGNAGSLSGYGPQLALLASALLTLGGWTLARQNGGFYPAMSLVMLALLVIWFSGSQNVLVLFAPALVALCALFARNINDETPIARVMAASLLTVALALVVTPALRPRSHTMETFAERLRTYITDTLFFSEPRSVYSIQADGYKPLEVRLGGPVELDERPVMTVETNRSLLLRGAIYNDYTGLTWRDTTTSRRYLYADPRNRGVRTDVFDETRPAAELRGESLFKAYDVRVSMQSDSASTLFLPLRVSSLVTPMELVPYFNQSSEIFITRDMEAGDTYTFSAPVITSVDARLPDIVYRASLLGGESRDMSAFKAVPGAVAEDVLRIVGDAIGNAVTPLDKALGIQRYLQNRYPYTLTPDMPPDNQDFVSYFLLRGKEGYCTYFASAMAVMGRIAGLPTRYVEGYIVDPSGGTALITSKQAHAWAEVYFDNFGWVSFDATPPASRGGPRQDEDPNAFEQEVEGEESEDEGDDPDGQENQEEDGEEDQDAPGSDDMSEGNDDPNNPGPNQINDLSGEEDPEPQGGKDKDRSLWWLWALLALAVVSGIVWWGLYTRPGRVVGRRRNLNVKLLLWYRALLGLLAAAGMPARPYESPTAYALRVEHGIPREAGFLAVATAVMRLGYGHESASPAEISAAEACYRAVWRAVPVKGRVRWTLRRMLRGLGNIKQVP